MHRILSACKDIKQKKYNYSTCIYYRGAMEFTQNNHGYVEG